MTHQITIVKTTPSLEDRVPPLNSSSNPSRKQNASRLEYSDRTSGHPSREKFEQAVNQREREYLRWAGIDKSLSPISEDKIAKHLSFHLKEYKIQKTYKLDYISQIFLSYDQGSDRTKEIIVDFMTKEDGFIARTHTRSFYELIVNELEKRGVSVPDDIKKAGILYYERNEKTQAFYKELPGRQSVICFLWSCLTQESRKKYESLCENTELNKVTLEQFEGLGNLDWEPADQTIKLSPYSAYAIHHIEQLLQDENRTEAWCESAYNSREVIFTCDPHGRDKGAYFAEYLEGLENDASFEFSAGIIPQEDTHETAEEIMMKGALAQTLQLLIDNKLIAHFWFSEDGTSCHIQC